MKFYTGDYGHAPQTHEVILCRKPAWKGGPWDHIPCRQRGSAGFVEGIDQIIAVEGRLR